MCKHLVSSANRYGMAEDKTSGISFIYKTKRSGPEYFTGETPATTGSRLDKTAIYFSTLCSGGQVGFKPQPKIPCNSIFPEFV